MHLTVPSQIASFGWSIILAGRTSQKRLEQGPKIDPFPSLHHQTTPPLPFTSGPWPHHVLYWLGKGWWRLGLARASLLNLSKRPPAAYVSAVTWRFSFCVFGPFMRAFFWSFASIRNWASYDDGLYISCSYLCFSLLPAVLAYSSCRNDSILLGPFLGRPLFLFSVAYHRHCFVSFYSWAPMSLCFLLLGIHGPFANSLGFPRPVC